VTQALAKPKKLIVFDLDGTLAESKSSIDPEMSGLLGDLLGLVKVAVISGGNWPQFQKQLLATLPRDRRLENLTLLPTCGTKFYRYDRDWQQLYSEDFTPDQKTLITRSLDRALASAGFQAGQTWGPLIEDRGSQITDALFPGGNDYPAKEAGVYSIRVRDCQETKRVIEAIRGCLGA